MPRIGRTAPGGLVYHVMNRVNGRRKLFLKDDDYLAFLELLAEAKTREPMRILGFCLMPNHWHLVLWPRRDGDLSRFMRWLSNTHVRRYHQHYHSYGQGHVYQGRFKSFPIKDDRHLLTVLRYIEANPLRAELVKRAQNWDFSSLTCRRSPITRVPLLDAWPLDRPRGWTALVNQRLSQCSGMRCALSMARGRPFGDLAWTVRIARRLSLQSTINPRGRPRKVMRT